MKDVRQGKFFEVELADADPATAKARVTEMADKLLANPVIESYRVEVLPEPGAGAGSHEIRGGRLSRIEFDYDAFYAASRVVGEDRPSSSGTRTPTSRAPTS